MLSKKLQEDYAETVKSFRNMERGLKGYYKGFEGDLLGFYGVDRDILTVDKTMSSAEARENIKTMNRIMNDRDGSRRLVGIGDEQFVPATQLREMAESLSARNLEAKAMTDAMKLVDNRRTTKNPVTGNLAVEERNQSGKLSASLEGMMVAWLVELPTGERIGLPEGMKEQDFDIVHVEKMKRKNKYRESPTSDRYDPTKDIPFVKFYNMATRRWDKKEVSRKEGNKVERISQAENLKRNYLKALRTLYARTIDGSDTADFFSSSMSDLYDAIENMSVADFFYLMMTSSAFDIGYIYEETQREEIAEEAIGAIEDFENMDESDEEYSAYQQFISKVSEYLK